MKHIIMIILFILFIPFGLNSGDNQKYSLIYNDIGYFIINNDSKDTIYTNIMADLSMDEFERSLIHKEDYYCHDDYFVCVQSRYVQEGNLWWVPSKYYLTISKRTIRPDTLIYHSPDTCNFFIYGEQECVFKDDTLNLYIGSIFYKKYDLNLMKEIN